LSLWPGGASSNAEGTIEWAGGPIDWQSSLMQPQNYYYAAFQSVTIQCYDPPPGARISGSQAYVLTSPRGDNTSFEIVDKSTILESFLGTGLDPNVGVPTASAAVASATAETIPGLSGAGTGVEGTRGGDTSTTGSGTNTGSGFSQGATSSGNDAAPAMHGSKALQGSIFAVILAIVGALLI
jgi:hypothetical protein